MEIMLGVAFQSRDGICWFILNHTDGALLARRELLRIVHFLGKTADQPRSNITAAFGRVWEYPFIEAQEEPETN
jgi:hypothetical protein